MTLVDSFIVKVSNKEVTKRFPNIPPPIAAKMPAKNKFFSFLVNFFFVILNKKRRGQDLHATSMLACHNLNPRILSDSGFL